ncbi:hypothetical protein Hanom_Chr02g00174021 [Helianthus anomalus]
MKLLFISLYLFFHSFCNIFFNYITNILLPIFSWGELSTRGHLRGWVSHHMSNTFYMTTPFP